jgi:hypothetical protein
MHTSLEKFFENVALQFVFDNRAAEHDQKVAVRIAYTIKHEHIIMHWLKRVLFNG